MSNGEFWDFSKKIASSKIVLDTHGKYEKIDVYTDGGTVPGREEITVGVYVPKLNIWLSKKEEGKNCHVAELRAAIRAFELLLHHRDKHINLLTDSTMLRNFIKGKRFNKKWFVATEQARLLLLVQEFQLVTASWIRRTENSVADGLARRAREACGQIT